MADSLYHQIKDVGVPVEWVVVDARLWYDSDRKDQLSDSVKGRFLYQHVPPKPTVWQGPTRLTSRDHWAAASARNTGIVYAKYPLLVFHDDCTFFLDGWLKHLHEAGKHGKNSIAGGYKYCKPGTVLEQGRWISGEFEDPGDHRIVACPELAPVQHPGWGYSGNLMLPLEAALQTNGFEEMMDGSGGLEDCEFSVRLCRVAPMYFEPKACNAQLMESHEPIHGYIGGKKEVPAQCKGFKLKDAQGTIHWMTYNHVVVWWLSGHTLQTNKEGFGDAVYNPQLDPHRQRYHTLGNIYTLKALREIVKAGKPLPIPEHPTRDWRDRQLLKEM